MRKLLLFVFLSLHLFSAPFSGNKHLCENIHSKQSYIQWVLENNPKIIALKQEIKALEFTARTAKALQNPELESEGTFDSASFSGETTLLQPIELGGKRKNRGKVILAKVNQLKAELTLKKERLVIEAMIRLHRLRQIEAELSLTRDTQESFLQIKKQYKKLVRLNPEQTISLSVIDILVNNLSFSRVQILNEQKMILGELKNAISCQIYCEDLKIGQIKPDPILRWPGLKINGSLSMNGGEYLIASNAIDLASSQYRLSKSKAWPDLSIGPKLEYSSENIRGGLSFSIPLPILNFRKGERKANQLRLENQFNVFNFKKTKIDRKRNILIDNYNRLVSLINRIDSSEIERKHKKLHEYADQGLLPFALIVEAHDEYINYFNQRHDAELEALSYYWSVLAMEDRLFEEVMK